MSRRLSNAQQIRQERDPMRLRASLRQHAAHNLQGEIVHPRLLGDECIQDLPAMVDLLLHRETRQPVHECGRWMQPGRAEHQRVATAAPVHGAQQGRQCLCLIGCYLQPPPPPIEATCQCRQRALPNVRGAASSSLHAFQQRFGVAKQRADIAPCPGAPLDRCGGRRPRPRSTASSPAREQGSADRSRCWFCKAPLPWWTAAVGRFLRRRAGSPGKAPQRRRKSDEASEQVQLMRRRNEDGQRHGAALQRAARTVCCAAT